MMNILQVTKCDQLNGPGLRVVLWVAGCSHHCDGCQNQYSWNPSAGVSFDENVKKEIFDELEKDWCSGITYSGGDPMFSGNRDEIIKLAKEIRGKFPNKSQWMYTGFSWNEIIEDETMSEILKYVDVVCDGHFEKSLKDVELEWVGSRNQKVIDVRKRIKIVSDLAKN